MDKNINYMKEALKIAKKGKGKVYPNPAVGCVIVKDGKIIARGWHDYFGGNHAEINALIEAGAKAKGADLYVTLEPCNSHGKRPPCTQAIIKAGIKRVYFAVKDPNVAAGAKTLKKAGIKVLGGILKKPAENLIKDYLGHLQKKSRVTIKAAMTLDGKIATFKNDSKWITSQQSRKFVHQLRTKYDAILVGTNTVLHDNPLLTSHSEGKNPVRVVIDAAFKIPVKYNLFDSSAPTVVIYDERITKLPKHIKKESIIPAPVNIKSAKKDFGVIIKKLDSLSLKTILIEGGGEVISSALFSGCVDDIYLFVAPKIIGSENAVSVVRGEGVSKIEDSLKVKNMNTKKIGPDLLITGNISRE